MTPIPKYEFELWVNGVQVGDVTKLIQNRKFTFPRNNTEQLSFDLDVNAFEDYCTSIGSVPSAILEPYVTDLRVKRNGTYKWGFQVVDFEFAFDESGASVSVKCTGFLDLFKDRYVTVTYSQIEAVTIGWGLIDTSQTFDPLNDFGVVQGVSQYNTGILRDRVYVDQNVKDGLINLTNLSDGNFDFRFNYDRSFETFAQIGSNRQENKFSYPYNIRSISCPRTATSLYNYIKAIGSGFGDEALRTETADAISRTNYGTREKIQTFSDISEQQTLDENAYGFLVLNKDILQLPKIKVSGVFCDLDVIGVGDRIPVEVQGHTMLPLNDTHRIEQIDLSLDENDAEDIDLTLDNYGL
jgi:hypothetical protein